MKAIWKFMLQSEDLQQISMPKGAQILCVQVQHGMPHLWAIVDIAAMHEMRAFWIIGTGHQHEVVPIKNYIGTYQLMGGDLIFHVFELRS